MCQNVLISPRVCTNKISFKQNQLSLNNRNLNFCSSDKISFSGRTQYLTLDNVMMKILGIFTLEDIGHLNTKVKRITKKYNKSDYIELNDLIDKDKKNLLLILHNNGIKFEQTEKGINFLDESITLKKKQTNKIKKVYMEMLASLESYTKIMNVDPLTNNPSINDWFKNIHYTGKMPNIFSSLYVHPIDKAKAIIGELPLETTKFIDKAVAFMCKRNLSVEHIETKRQNSLNSIEKILNTKSFQNTGMLSKSEINRIKKNVIRYIICDKIHPEYRIFSKNAETIIANIDKSLSNKNIGDTIDGYGLVIQKMLVYDKRKGQKEQCLVVFSKDKKDQSINLIKIDLELEQSVQNFLQKYKEIKIKIKNNQTKDIKTKIKELEQNADEIIEKEKSLKIAQIYVRIASVQNLKSFFRGVDNIHKIDMFSSYFDEIEKVKKGEPTRINKIALILGFKNFEPKRFINAGKNIALTLIHLLKEHKCNDVFIQALAREKSALPMYLRAGFKPIYPTEQELTEVIKTNNKWSAQSPVFMYLPKNAIVYDVIDKKQPLKEIFSK